MVLDYTNEADCFFDYVSSKYLKVSEPQACEEESERESHRGMFLRIERA